jgi:hypothetical protein
VAEFFRGAAGVIGSVFEEGVDIAVPDNSALRFVAAPPLSSAKISFNRHFASQNSTNL